MQDGREKSNLDKLLIGLSFRQEYLKINEFINYYAPTNYE